MNSELTNKQSKISTSCQQLDSELSLPMMLFCLEYPTSDKVNFNINQIWTTQIIKAIYLFQFLEVNEKTKQLLSAFLVSFNCSSWIDFLKSLLPLTIPAITREREAHTDIIIEPNEKFEESCAFIAKLMIQENDSLDPNDFLTLRAKPFYKIEEGTYRIIFDLFVVEKLFKGIYFLLRDVNKSLPKAQRIKEIRSFYGIEISEKILCYKAIESIYSENCIRFSGYDLSEMKIDGTSDYYIRKGNNIILFESKDFLIQAEKKASFDYDIYEQEFQRVLYYKSLPNGKEQHKAVMQLINNVRQILKKEFAADTDYHYKEVSIYPVLLTHDHQYDVPGFNELLNFWFQDELLGLKEEGLFIHRVKPLTVVNIDTLIYNQVGLSEIISLHDLLKLYVENKKNVPLRKKFRTKQEADEYYDEAKSNRISKLLPFDAFVSNYFAQKGGWKLPPIVDIVAPALFKDEYEARTENALT